MPFTQRRVQVTVDRELDAALAEFGGRSRSRAVRDLAVRSAEALREEEHPRGFAVPSTQRLA
jgi:metal-responsive CopG/Arc/MetJ family transcriptional regulator